MPLQVIHIHQNAPSKPVTGAACNGCGLCCLSEPCPVGMVVSLKRTGACSALRWDAGERRYRCGMMAAGSGRWPALLRRLMRRYIAAGAGCDADVHVEQQPARRVRR